MKTKLAAILITILLAAVTTLLMSNVIHNEDRPSSDVIGCCVTSKSYGWSIATHETSTDGTGITIVSSEYSPIGYFANFLIYLVMYGLGMTCFYILRTLRARKSR
jgi:hypothetical protein